MPADTVIISGKPYAAHLLWLVPQSNGASRGILKDALREARAEEVRADLVALDPLGRYFGLGWTSRGHRARMPVMASAMAAAARKSSWLAAVRCDNGWWVGAAVDGCVVSQVDNVAVDIAFESEERARQRFGEAFTAISELVDEFDLVAPASWGFDVAREMTGAEVAAAMIDPVELRTLGRLSALSMDKGALLRFGALLLLAAAGVGGWQIYQYQQERAEIERQKAAAWEAYRNPPRPWLNMPEPRAWLAGCYDGIERLYWVVPGWKLKQITCSGSGPSVSVRAEWERQQDADALPLMLQAKGADVPLNMVNDRQASAAVSRPVQVSRREVSLLGRDELRMRFHHLTESIGIQADLTLGPQPNDLPPLVIDGESIPQPPAFSTASIEMQAVGAFPLALGYVLQVLPGGRITEMTWQPDKGSWNVKGNIYEG